MSEKRRIFNYIEELSEAQEMTNTDPPIVVVKTSIHQE